MYAGGQQGKNNIVAKIHLFYVSHAVNDGQTVSSGPSKEKIQQNQYKLC